MEDFNKKEACSYFNKLGFAYLILSIIANGMQILFADGLGLVIPGIEDNYNLFFAIYYIGSSLIAYPVGIFIIKKMVSKSVYAPDSRIEGDDKWMTKGRFFMCLIISWGLTYAGNILASIITSILGLIKGNTVDNPLIGLVGETNILVQIIAMVILAPVAEELIFRKILINRLIKYGEGCAVILSGVVFALFHGNFSQAPYAFMLGVFFAYIYIRTGKVRYSMMIHMFINFLGSVVAGTLLRLIELDKLTQSLSNGISEEYFEYVSTHGMAMIIYVSYAMLILSAAVAGIILLLVNRKKFRLEMTGISIPKGERFKTIIVNPGMLLLIAFWMVFFVLSIIR